MLMLVVVVVVGEIRWRFPILILNQAGSGTVVGGSYSLSVSNPPRSPIFTTPNGDWVHEGVSLWEGD